jgi:transposase-like protein
MSVLSEPQYHNEEAAYAFVEAHVWPNGRVCPHCGVFDKSGALKGKSTRIGVYKCYACRKPFTVKVGTIFEASHVKLHIWLQAMFLLCSSKKGISSNQLHRTFGVTLKTPWFMSHRIREAMREGKLPGSMGGDGKFVEADETYVGGKAKNRAYKNPPPKEHVKEVTAATLKPILADAIVRDTHFRTDESGVYHSIKEYVRGDAHTNTVEGYFSIFKRGIYGVYHHVSAEHLKRYLAEFDFRYNERAALGVDDVERASRALRGIVGKRLTYRTTDRSRA